MTNKHLQTRRLTPLQNQTLRYHVQVNTTLHLRSTQGHNKLLITVLVRSQALRKPTSQAPLQIIIINVESTQEIMFSPLIASWSNILICESRWCDSRIRSCGHVADGAGEAAIPFFESTGCVTTFAVADGTS
jgi:hypothetical protein